MFTLREVECLGSCANAPMIQVHTKIDTKTDRYRYTDTQIHRHTDIEIDTHTHVAHIHSRINRKTHAGRQINKCTLTR